MFISMGKVTSRTIGFFGWFHENAGHHAAGEYEFNTAEKEIMEILAGDLEVSLPGADEWIAVKGG